ncbi:unnamed protein product [Zymoseptoria tritici ST99CH_1A5]|uniref:DUF6589 domain-containing protein n=1 Tax=Zymoseptoria tritici ST99CH_1A5 TaxID=1276529 RepID=A0A1Y6L6I0_ZYMTR|nr:unnamed protein product [Zymoseptoria tritici ST99CH_1A5]
MRTWLKESRENEDDFDRMQWVLPLPGLFHLKMCLIQAIENNFNGREGCRAKSSLLVHREMMERKICPSFHAPHSHLERLTLDSFNARVLAFVYEEIDPVVPKRHVISNYIQALSADGFIGLVGKVYEKVFSPSARRLEPDAIEADTQKAKNSYSSKKQQGKKAKATEKAAARIDGNEERRNHVRFLHVVETYHMLSRAVKYADISLLRRVVNRCILIFHARSHKNYAFIILWMKWLTDSEASDPVLQRAMLANGFVNIAGTEDSWFEIDRANEFLNRYLKTLISSRRNRTFDVENQLEEATLLATHTSHLREVIEAGFGESTNTKHTSPKSVEEVHAVAAAC